MTVPSTEVPAGEVAKPEEKVEHRVPVGALAKERADKRAAQSEAEQLKGKLEQASGTIDATLLAQISEQLAAEARKAVQDAIAPIQAEADMYRMGMKHGLNEAQAGKVMELRQKNPGLTEDQALLLARASHQDIFPSPASVVRAPGGYPVGGDSPARSAQTEDLVAKMREAEAKGDRQAANQFATQEALRRFRRGFENRR